MEPKMGRPKSGHLSSFDNSIRSKIDQYRPQKEGWSALTIEVELGLEPKLRQLDKPSVSSIHRYLKSSGKIKPRARRVELPVRPCACAAHPHDLWQLDAKGNEKAQGLGTVSMINIKDVDSKSYISTYPCVFLKPSSHPTTAHYQTALRMGWMEFGMNKRLQVDHESIFHENSSASPFPTSFHLWLIGLGIELCFTPKGKPQKQGIVEKSHQTIQTQVMAGKTYEDERSLILACQKRRQRLNYHIPSKATSNLPPLKADPEAQSSDRHYQPQHEKALFKLDLIYKYLREGKWFRRVASSKTIHLGGQVYYLSKAIPKTELEIFFDQEHRKFKCFNADGELIGEVEPKGLSFKELAKNLDEFKVWVKNIPFYSPEDF